MVHLVRRLQALEDNLAAEPLIGRDEVPAADAEDGDGAEDDAGEVERLGCRGEEERRDLGLERGVSTASLTVDQGMLTEKTSALKITAHT